MGRNTITKGWDGCRSLKGGSMNEKIVRKFFPKEMRNIENKKCPTCENTKIVKIFSFH